MRFFSDNNQENQNEKKSHLKPSNSKTFLEEDCGIKADNDDSANGAAGTTEAMTTVEKVILKIPEITIIYWCEKMTATTFGETFADFWTQTLGLGYSKTAMVLMSIFVASLAFQLRVKTYWPLLFWLVMSTSSIAGTCFSDFIDRTLGWGYPMGMGVLLGLLLFVLACWKLTGMHMNVAGAMDRKQEAFYWLSILISNTLGTALGDFFADSLLLGFGYSALIFGSALTVCAGLVYVPHCFHWEANNRQNWHVVLFWVAFVLTRPFGATFGDFLTKPKSHGGLALGTLNASMVILALFFVFFVIEMLQLRKKRMLEETPTTKELVDVDEKDVEQGQKKATDEVVDAVFDRN